jgi:hypothetical protein
MKVMTFETLDGSKWAVPVDVIAKNRAAYYAHEFDGDIDRSLKEDTLLLFAEDDYEIEDWAVSNMNFSDVADSVFLVSKPPRPDFQEAWLNGAKDITEIDRPQPAVTQPESNLPKD